MRHDDVPDASLPRRLDEREHLVAAEVARTRDEAVAGDDVQHLVGLGQQHSSVVDDRHGVAREAGVGERELERDPDGHLVVHAGFSTSSCSLTAETVGNHTMRAPGGRRPPPRVR